MFSADSSVFARKHGRSAGLDQLDELQFVVRRDEDHPHGAPIGRETTGEIETTVGAKVDVDESDVGPQLLNTPNRLSR